jgi:hypothetical protein
MLANLAEQDTITSYMEITLIAHNQDYSNNLFLIFNLLFPRVLTDLDYNSFMHIFIVFIVMPIQSV